MGPVESQLREDLADAMKENLGIPVQINEEPGELLFYKIILHIVFKALNNEDELTLLGAE